MTRNISALEWWRIVVAHAALTDAYGTAGVSLPNPAQIDYPSLATVWDSLPPGQVPVVQVPLAAPPASPSGELIALPADALPPLAAPPAVVPPEGVMPGMGT